MNDHGSILAQPLAQLATQNLKELHHRRDDGSRQIDELYAACSASGFISKPALDVRSRYCSVFDVALEHHFGCWVIDYVEEVCGDTALMSNDPAEAQLLDGEFVRSWCEKTLQGLEAAAVAALKSEQLFVHFLNRQLHKDMGKVAVLLSILEALGRIQNAAFTDRKAAASRRGVDAELKQAALLQKCFQVMAWCARHALHDKPHTGRFSSVPDWMRQVHRRREKLPHGQTLFLDDALQALHMSGAYPFSSLQNMLYMLFLTVREGDGEAQHAQQDLGAGAVQGKGKGSCSLKLLLYYLLDLDHLQPGQLEDFRVTFSLPASCVACWHAMFLLDCVQAEGPAPGSGPDPSPLLAQACELLRSQVQGTTPFKVIQVLVGLGRADVALSLHWAQAGPQAAAGACSLEHAVTLLDLRLRCGLLVEAFLAMRSHCSSLPEPQRTEHSRALTVHLAENAAAEAACGPPAASGERSQLQLLCELPWDPEEEDALVGWLVQQLQAGRAAGDLLPLYFLGRGRVPEALGAYNHWQLRGQASRGCSGLQSSVDALVNAAAGLLPLPQRNVCVSEAPGGGGGPEPRWAVKLLAGLSLQADNNVPVMSAVIHGGQPPPFMTSYLPPQPSAPASEGAAPRPPAAQDDAVGEAAAALTAAPDAEMPATYDSLPGPSLFSLPFTSSQTSHLFQPQPAYGAEAEPPPVPGDVGHFPLFGPPARQGPDSRDPKRARTHNF